MVVTPLRIRWWHLIIANSLLSHIIMVTLDHTAAAAAALASVATQVDTVLDAVDADLSLQEIEAATSPRSTSTGGGNHCCQGKWPHR